MWLKWVKGILGLLIATWSCNQTPEAGETKVSAKERPVSLTASALYVCGARSVLYNSWESLAPGNSIPEAMALARSDCEQFTGDQACVITTCGTTLDTGTSNLNGRTICEWESLRLNTRGFAEGNTRKEAKKAALQTCSTGGAPGFAGAGIDCTILVCFARLNRLP